jgi:hypothetical protein
MFGYLLAAVHFGINRSIALAGCMQCVSANWGMQMNKFCNDKNEAFDVCATHLDAEVQYCSKLLFRKGCLKGIKGTASDKLTCQDCADYVTSTRCPEAKLKNTCLQYYGQRGDLKPGALRRRL